MLVDDPKSWWGREKLTPPVLEVFRPPDMQKDFMYFLNHNNQVLQEEVREMQLCHKMSKELNMETNEVVQVHHYLRYIFRMEN